MKCLAFDLGKVLFDFDYHIALNKLEHKLDVPAKTVVDELFYNNFATDFEKGLVATDDFYRKFKNKFASRITYEEFVDIWCEIFTPKPDIISLVGRLRLCYPVYLISNINELHFNHLYAKHPEVFSLFDDLLLSFRLKSLKPEKEIYEALQKKCGCAYSDIVYIDDREDLIREAKQLGLQCILCTDYNALTKDLTDYGVLIPSDTETETFVLLKHKIEQSKNPLIIGIGNTLRNDDSVGPAIAEAITGRIKYTVINAGASPENFISTIRRTQSDLLLLVDAAKLPDNKSCALLPANNIQNLSLYFTHDASLKMMMHYLQNETASDILFFAINANDYAVGETMSPSVQRIKTMTENFFMRFFAIHTKITI
ncbi:MAG: HAD-IA family hydrolase [Candidatus Omnitrophota bacterium]